MLVGAVDTGDHKTLLIGVKLKKNRKSPSGSSQELGILPSLFFLGGGRLVGWLVFQVSERQGWKQGQLSRGFLVASSGECLGMFFVSG